MTATDAAPALGAAEAREDAPLKGAGGGCGGGPRLALGAFGALSAAITLALASQIYYGDYEVVPHGSVASDAGVCSRAGTDALKEGGRALDAAVAAALCLAVVAPHTTSLDASGALVHWEYRGATRAAGPTVARWGGGAAEPAGESRPPRLVAALAALHAARGALPWSRVLRPAIDLARDGFVVSEGLAAALGGAAAAGSARTAPPIAAYLESLRSNSSRELAAAWNAAAAVRETPLAGDAAGAGGARLYSASAAAARAVRAALEPPPPDADEATRRVLSALLSEAEPEDAAAPAQAASGLAVVDRLDTYLALVTGLSVAFGSGPASAAGWRRDEPRGALDLAPAVIVEGRVCGARYVIGAESGAALAQAAAALGAGEDARAAVERARAVLRGGSLASEARRAATLSAGALPAGATAAAPPYAAVNLVQQTGDALLSYADSRGGGLSSRF